MEITSEKQNKVKRMKRTEDSLRDLWGISHVPTFKYMGPRRKRKKESI